METMATTCHSLDRFYHINGDTFERQYKEVLSGYRQWRELSHANEWLIFPENVGKRLCIDETSMSNGELYTIVTNPERNAGKGTLVAIIEGVASENIIKTLELIPEDRRNIVEGLHQVVSDAVVSTLKYTQNFDIFQPIEGWRKYRIKVTDSIHEPQPIIKQGDKIVVSRGNILTVQGRAKAYKTFLVSVQVVALSMLLLTVVICG